MLIIVSGPQYVNLSKLWLCVGCRDDFSKAVLWNANSLNHLVTAPCSDLHSSFHYSVSMSRWCKPDGTWSLVDLRNCTMLTDSQPVLIVYYTLKANLSSMIKNVSCTYIYIYIYCYSYYVSACLLFG